MSTFHYFGVMAKGFAPLLALEEHKVDYTAKAYDFESWTKFKATGVCPFGQLPMMETPDCGAIGQQAAILGYVARKSAAAAGETEKDKVLSDMMNAFGEEMYMLLVKNQDTTFAKDKVPKEEVTKMWAETLPGKLALAEKLLNGADKFTTSGTTVGELNFFSHLHQMVLVTPACLDATPAVKSFHARILNLPSTQRVLNGETSFGKMAQYFIAC